jgi:hypothetical protein
MADVIFEEDQDTAARPLPVSSQPSALVKIVYKLGLAKTQKGAEYVLIGTIIVCIILMIMFLTFGGVFQTPGPQASALGPQTATPSAGVHVP